VTTIRSAEIIAVGSELLTPTRLDTNSLVLTNQLNALGIDVRLKTIVGDSRDDLRGVLSQAVTRSDLVVLSGGLGPTDDDVTRDVVAELLSRPLAEDGELVARLQTRFAKRGLDMPAINRRQAMVPAGAEVLPNPNGTAPGLWLEHKGCVIVLLPGPPRELTPMFEAVSRERLAARAEGVPLLRGIVRVAGQTESHAEQRAKPFYERWRERGVPIDATTLAAPASIDFHLTVRSPDREAGRRVLDEAVGELAAAFGTDAYATEDRGMEYVVGQALRTSGLTVAVAESCTGGLLGSRLTDVPGSSAYFLYGIVAYSNQAKQDLLGVDAALIEAHGAVSEPVALAMAGGVRRRAATSIGIGVTGIAGPDGGTADKPVGTVAIAVEGPWGAAVRTRTFPGGREQVKFFATQAAMDDLRRALLQRRGQ